MKAPNSRWYVVQTHPNAETRAAQHLHRQGFETYLPRYLKRRRHARRVEIIAAALFPRYLFVAVDVTSQRWRAIHSTVGVSRLVCNGSEPAMVAEGVVDGLRRRENSEGFVQMERRTRFAQGDQVRVVEGVFASCLGLFDGVSDKQRVTVLLDLLGRKVRVLVDELALATA